MASISSTALPASVSGLQWAPRKNNSSKVAYVSSYNGRGLPIQISTLGRLVGNAQGFAMAVQNSLRLGKKRRGGGALSVTCSAASEIFRIAAIMNGLTLVGVAVGFVLLRIEAAVEESD